MLKAMAYTEWRLDWISCLDLVVVSNDALMFFRSGFDTGGDGNSGVVGDDDAETHGSGGARRQSIPGGH